MYKINTYRQISTLKSNNVLQFNPDPFFFFTDNVPPQQIVNQWAAQGIDEMDFDEASSEIRTTEMQLQNCEEISQDKIAAFNGQLISERNFGSFKSPKKRTIFALV